MLRIAPYLYLPVTDMPGDFEVSFYAVVRGFHVYQQEHGNPEDAYAQHLPRSNYKHQV